MTRAAETSRVKSQTTVRRRRAAASDLPRLLQGLEQMTIDDLRAEWPRWLPGNVPPIGSRDVLRRLIAWRVQAQVYGGHDPETQRRLKRLVAAHCTGKALVLDTAKPRLNAGTILAREWKGVIHRVTVEDRAFVHEGRRYRTLSEIARAITGTRWSGPRFFGTEVDPSPKPEKAHGSATTQMAAL